MAKGRELKGRIKSVENTRKITRTMEMVATSKMKRAQDRVAAARPYATALARRDRAACTRPSSPSVSRCCASRRQVQTGGGAPASRRTAAWPARSTPTCIKEARGTHRAPASARAPRSSCTSSAARAIGFFRYLGRALATQRAPTSPTVRRRRTRPRWSTALMERLRRRRARRGVRRLARASTRRCSTPPHDRRGCCRCTPPARRARAARLPALPVGRRRSSPSCSRSYVRNARLPRARRDRRPRDQQRAAHGDEERDRQRGRHADVLTPHVQPRPSGADHAGNRRDRRRRRGARR